MAGLTNTAEQDVANMIFIGTDPTWRAGASWYLALFTADPTETGSLANEATFTGYARVAITKATGWNVTGGVATNTGLVQFPECTGGSNIITHGAIVTASSAGTVVYIGNLGEARTVTAGNTLQYPASSISFSID